MAIRGFFQRYVRSGNTLRANPVFSKSALGMLVGAIISGPALAADLTTPEAQRQLDRALTQEGINYTVMHEGLDSQRIIMSGNSNLEALRKALYGLPAQQGFLRGSTTITISGRMPKDKTVAVILESNLATGYSWELAGSANSTLSQDGDSAYESRGLLGGTAKQTIRVRATQEGVTETRLIYRRPWEQDSPAVQTMAASAPNKITIQLDEIPDVIDLSDPNATEQAMPEDEHKKLFRPTAESMLPMAALPAAWDWRTSGAGLTPVRDQGNCGSCWAFATVGALESTLKVKMGSDVNASEQFLVSCNNNSYSCSGGWFAHDYHANTLGKLQTVAGAAPETDMPYTASNGSCKALSNHPNRISSWSYLAGYTVPSVDQIKNAIYTYGSVAAAVCVGSAFQGYRSGVFATDESAACGTNKVNHAIVLVGWDDATQSWVLRNSWGPSWAEQGYMRIKYGTSNVGFGANYVVLAQGASQSISAISFTPATLAVGGTTTASATATSKLTVAFSTKTASICTVSGNTVKGIAAGTCVVAADQAGDASYNAAPQVTQSITVGGKSNQSISAISFTPATLAVGGT
ncbi:MAG TPA: C1 family peptidase, partial [Candidatus Competibacteraceae bacterium]|nr:C1 family peptidase [Candidatus Competibacteraceae bacterium]